MGRLTAVIIDRARRGELAPGRYRDADGLMLIAYAGGASWTGCSTSRGQTDAPGRGPLPEPHRRHRPLEHSDRRFDSALLIWLRAAHRAPSFDFGSALIYVLVHVSV